MACPVRKYPLVQPEHWTPPIPRWQLVLPEHVSSIYTLYVGVQTHSTSKPTFDKAIGDINTWLANLNKPDQDVAPKVVDKFLVETGHDLPSTRVWACYWMEQSSFDHALSQLNLPSLHRSLGDDRSSIGLWLEHFVTPVSRLETNYAGLHEAPGLARLPDTTREPHELTGYWGAARDRTPDSANDLFEIPGTQQESDDPKLHPYKRLPHATDDPNLQPPDPVPEGFGQHLQGISYDNVVHIRSGQCWNQCSDDEAEAYENNLQKSLMKGMAYLWENPVYTGTLGLRWLRNIADAADRTTPASTDCPLLIADDADTKPINETSGAGFFRNLRDLEVWSSSHDTHKEIFSGVHAHARKWGKDRKFMTWHEVSILKKGEAKWEYVNCDPRTGVIRFVKMDEAKNLDGDL